MAFVIETDRLLLREIEPTDTQAMFELDSNPNVMQYLGGKTVESVAVTQKIIQMVRQQYIQNGIGRYAVILKETNECIGWSGIKYVTEPENNFVDFYDLGYRLLEKYWGKGYGYECALPWIDHAFNTMKIDKLNADAHIENIGSNKILQRLGFQFLNEYEWEGYPFNWYELKNQNIR